jgi:ionotropic glutamate receptor
MQIFQKGSPMARDFSKAILSLSENGKLKALEDAWLTPLDECSTNITSNTTQSLSLQSFWVLYLISFATSTICFLLSLICSPINRRKHQHAYEGNVTPDDESVWKKAVTLVRYFRNKSTGTAPLADTLDINLDTQDVVDTLELSFPAAEVEITTMNS